MSSELRKTGISMVGDVPWGTHFCHFYETKQDLLDILVPYFKTGLESNEFCLWVVSDTDLITVEEAKKALAQVVPDLDRQLSKGNLEILNAHQWYFEKHSLNLERVRSAWDAKLKQALARGYDGLRASADTFWLAEKDLKDFCRYEKQVDDWVTDQRMNVLCTYPLAKSGGAEVLDVMNVHQFATARRQGDWQVIQNPESLRAKAEVKRLTEDLQRTVKKTPEPPFILRFGVAVLAVIVALIINRLLSIHLVGAPAMLFLCALMFSAWYGGAKPALLAMPLAVLAFAYYFVTPYNSLALDVREIPRLSLFMLASLFVISLSAAQKRAAESLRHARDVLAGTVEELKRTNQALRTEIVERKQAEAAVRRAEDRIRLVIDTIPTMAWSLEPEGTLDFVNQRWIDYTGLSLEEALTDANRIVYPEDLPQALGKWASNMANGKLHEAEMRLRRVDGEYRWFLVRVSPLRDAHGKIVKWYGVSLDIEDRKRAEIAAWALIDAIPQQIWSTPPDGKNDYVNERWRAETGLGPEDGQGDGWQTLLHPDDRDRVLKAWEYSVRHGTPYAQEARHRGADGSYRWYLNRGVPQRDNEGRILRWYGTYTDIEDRKRAEEELKREKELLEKIFDNIPVMIGFVGQDDGVKLVNPEWERSIGWTLKELQKQNVDIFAEAYPDPSYRQEVLDFVAAATGEWVDLKIKVRDGRVMDAACAVVGLSDGTRVAIAQDITERKEAEETLKRSETQLAEAQRMAHVGSWDWDLRTGMVTWSEELYRIFGLQSGTIKTAGDAAPFLHPNDRDFVWNTVRHAVSNKEPYSFYFRILRPDGTERIAHARGSVVSDERGDAIRVFGVSQDVTELKRAEERLNETTEQLRALSARLQSAREEESKRIAREIHDELGGALTSWKWDLEEIREGISEPLGASQVSALQTKIDGMMSLTETTLDTVRKLASELRPMALEVGLVEALEWESRQFENRTGMAVQLECSLEKVNLNYEQSTAVFRIVQEALTNVLRHAQATKVMIAVKEESGQFLLTISDDGRGIPENGSRQSLGLLGMRERAHLVGGEIDIESIDGKGTRISVQIPISTA